jgi:hypothetical protein
VFRKRPSTNSVPYLEKLSQSAQTARSLEEIRSSIEQQGYWEAQVEWRISTVTTSRVERTAHLPPRFLVRVECDNRFETHCPTIERAFQFLGIYERLIQDLFWTVGWPSWVTERAMKPTEDDH